MPVVPATWEAESGESLEPGKWRLHSSLVTEQDFILKQNKTNNNEKSYSVHLKYIYALIYILRKLFSLIEWTVKTNSFVLMKRKKRYLLLSNGQVARHSEYPFYPILFPL